MPRQYTAHYQQQRKLVGFYTKKSKGKRKVIPLVSRKVLAKRHTKQVTVSSVLKAPTPIKKPELPKSNTEINPSKAKIEHWQNIREDYIKRGLALHRGEPTKPGFRESYDERLSGYKASLALSRNFGESNEEFDKRTGLGEFFKWYPTDESEKKQEPPKELPKPAKKEPQVKRFKVKIEHKTKDQTKMTYIEKAHLKALAKNYSIDSAEIDSTISYEENKDHLMQQAKANSYSQDDIQKAELESDRWKGAYEDFLENVSEDSDKWKNYF